MRCSDTHLEESSEATTRLLAAHRATTRALCEATSLDAGLFSVLEALAISLNYGLGELWTSSPSAEVLVCQFLWPLPEDPVEFEVLRHELALLPGEERPGRVWSRGQAEIACDTSVTPTFTFHAHPGAPSHHVLCFPLAHEGQILGVVQLFADHAPTCEEGQLLLTASVLGQQMGQFVFRMSASAKVRESGIRKAGAVESALDCIVTVDHEGRIKDVNTAATTTFGYPRGDVLGRPLLDLVVPASKAASPGLVAFLSDGPASLVGKRVETRALRADGSSFPIELALTRIARSGRPLFAATVRDITERRQNEDQLRRSREQLAIILQGVSEGITAQDSAGRIVFANDAAAKLLGRATAADLLDLRVADLDHDLCLVEVAGAPFFLGRLPDALRTKNHLETTLRVSTARDPVETWSAIQASPVKDATGRLQLAIVIWRDITETLRAERAQRFLAVVQSALAESLDHLATLAAVARLSVACMADWCAIDLLGMDGAVQRLEAGGIDLHPKADSPANEPGPPLCDPLPLCDPIRVIRTGQPELVVRAPSLRQDCLLRSYLSVPLRYQDRTLGALTWGSTRPGRSYGQADLDLAMDMARRAAIAVEHARLFAHATAAVRLRDDFLCVASHELKTPLTALKLQVQALQRKDRQAHCGDSSSAPKRSGLPEIGSQVEYLTSLIDNLLDVSRLTAGQLLLRLEEVDLCTVVKDIVARSQNDLRTQGCPLSARIAGPIVGHWDRLRLEQIVTNLLSNAMKYGMGKPIEVVVDADEGKAKLTVRDFGIGIATENQARIFQRYERAAPSTQYGGLGLGLWIVRQIVDALEGSVQVTSQPDVGSTFTVTLPRQREAAP